MGMITTELLFDINRTTPQHILSAKARDSVRRLVFSFTDNGRPFAFSESDIVIFKATEDKESYILLTQEPAEWETKCSTYFVYDSDIEEYKAVDEGSAWEENKYYAFDCRKTYGHCTVNLVNNTATYDLTNSTLRQEGVLCCEVEIIDSGTGRSVASPTFSIIVVDRVYDDGAVEAANEFSALENALRRVNNLDVSVSKTGDSATISVTKTDGTTEKTTIIDGADGQDGYTPQKGIDYFDGKDGADGKDGEDGKDADVTILSNALKGYSKGGFLTDISPIEHNIVCRVKSKNKMPNKVLNLVNWTNTKFNTYYFYSIELEAGKTYCLSGYSSSTTGKYDYLYLQKSNDNFATLSNVIQLFRDSTHNNGKTFFAEEGYQYRLYYYGTPENFSQYYDLMIEEGTSITQYAPMLEDLTQSGVAYANDELGTNEQFVYADENGDIEGIVSLFPLMTFKVVYKTSDIATESAVLEIIYNRDINKAFEELKNAIISLGGNV